MADADGRRTYIEASKKGLKLYERYGWVRVDAVVMDTLPLGGEGIEETVLLIREPKPKKEVEGQGKAE